jgi:hypothetical protein
MLYFCSGGVGRDAFGHYGLANPVYTRFASPIIRYAWYVPFPSLMRLGILLTGDPFSRCPCPSSAVGYTPLRSTEIAPGSPF